MKCILVAIVFFDSFLSISQPLSGMDPTAVQSLFLRSKKLYHGGYDWQMISVKNAAADGKSISLPTYIAPALLPAIVPGTVLTSLVANGKYPDPYYGDNNRKSRNLIPDIADVGREFYHYWFRTEFSLPKSFAGKRVWLKFHGINYRSVIWVNGRQIGNMEGMFNSQSFDITTVANSTGKNILAVDVQPVDNPGSYYKPGKS